MKLRPSIAWERNERNAVARKDGVGFPVRAILAGNYSYIYNFRPDRYPEGTPSAGYREIARSPTKDATCGSNDPSKCIIFMQDPAWTAASHERLYGLRPQEELYNFVNDPYARSNLANLAEFAVTKHTMKGRLFAELRAQNDPWMFGSGSVFDKYPRKGGLSCRNC